MSPASGDSRNEIFDMCGVPVSNQVMSPASGDKMKAKGVDRDGRTWCFQSSDVTSEW
jgi:hypothetical protein